MCCQTLTTVQIIIKFQAEAFWTPCLERNLAKCRQNVERLLQVDQGEEGIEIAVAAKENRNEKHASGSATLLCNLFVHLHNFSSTKYFGLSLRLKWTKRTQSASWIHSFSTRERKFKPPGKLATSLMKCWEHCLVAFLWQVR